MTSIYENMFKHLYELSKNGKLNEMKEWLERHSQQDNEEDPDKQINKGNQSSIDIDDNDMPVSGFDCRLNSNLPKEEIEK